jgi:hypothetical protein
VRVFLKDHVGQLSRLLRSRTNYIFKQLLKMFKLPNYFTAQRFDTCSNVKDAGLENTVFAVLGGIPSTYEEDNRKS